MNTTPTKTAGVRLATAPNGVSYLLEDSKTTGCFGTGRKGWWVTRLLGPRARSRFLRDPSSVERMEVGRASIKRAAIDLAADDSRRPE